MNKFRIAILGGGITGLSAAFHCRELMAQHNAPVEITILERSKRVGGCIETRHEDGFTLEMGPDSLVTEKAAAIDLAKRLALNAEIQPIQSKFRGACVVNRGRLLRLPDSFRLFTPTSLGGLIGSRMLSASGIARAALEPFVRSKSGEDDESLANFVIRRFGREVLDRLAQPLIGGIYSGDPERLSMKATLPQMLALEKKYGSIVRGMNAGSKRTSQAQPHRMVSLRGGLGSLTTALEHELCDSIRTDCEVRSLERIRGAHGPEWKIALADGGDVFADAVICALPAFVAARVLKPVDSSLSSMLESVRYNSVATISLAYRNREIPALPPCSGFVVPQIENRKILAATFASQKYADRTPRGQTLLRAFAGGALQPHLLSLSDAELIKVVQKEFQELLGIKAKPRLAIVRRFPNALPQYSVGHSELVEQVEGAVSRFDRLALAGSAYRGVGIADCVRSAETSASRICNDLLRSPLQRHDVRTEKQTNW